MEVAHRAFPAYRASLSHKGEVSNKDVDMELNTDEMSPVSREGQVAR